MGSPGNVGGDVSGRCSYRRDLRRRDVWNADAETYAEIVRVCVGRAIFTAHVVIEIAAIEESRHRRRVSRASGDCERTRHGGEGSARDGVVLASCVLVRIKVERSLSRTCGQSARRLPVAPQRRSEVRPRCVLDVQLGGEEWIGIEGSPQVVGFTGVPVPSSIRTIWLIAPCVSTNS